MTTQEIIDGLQNILSYCRYHENAPALREAIRILTEMAEAEDAPDTNVDTISRQSAIRIASGYCHPSNIAKELAKLPSAQPEIIRCKDCKHLRFFDPCFYCYEFGDEINVPENGFCFMAKRRTDSDGRD